MAARPAVPRAGMAAMSHTRSPRDTGHGGWKNDGLSANKADMRAAVRLRPERSARDESGPTLRGASSASRGRHSYDRDGGRPMSSMGDQAFGSGRQVVVERHGRDAGPSRKDWHCGSGSQGSGGFQDSRRMGEHRGSLMAQHSSHSSSGMNRIVQITNNSLSSSSNAGGFKPFKGAPRRF